MPKIPPRKKLSSAEVTSHDVVIEVLKREITSFFVHMLEPEKGWNGVTHEQFLEGLAEAIVALGNREGADKGLAMLQTFVYDLQDLINAGYYALPMGPVVEKVEVPANKKTTPIPRVVDRKQYQNEPVEIFTWNPERGGALASDSPLSRLGYSASVGGPSKAKRADIILSVFCSADLPGVESNAEKKRWGAAQSPQRLYAISRHLSWLCGFQGGEKPEARKKWMVDLEWLKAELYDPNMGFSWPEEDDLLKEPVAKRTPNAAFMEVLILSPALAAVVGDKPLPRTEIVSGLWTYIKANNLQDKVNKRMINADAKLKAVFGKAQVSMFEMAGLIGKHVK